MEALIKNSANNRPLTILLGTDATDSHACALLVPYQTIPERVYAALSRINDHQEVPGTTTVYEPSSHIVILTSSYGPQSLVEAIVYFWELLGFDANKIATMTLTHL